MNTHELMADIGVSALRTSPPFVFYTVSGDGILVAIGILSGLLNIAYLVWKWRREARKAA